ncbi:DNA polymerase III subunit delta' [Sphingomonas edaphi]|uniref:DNA polymerase III subunit delta n=2 Tax=Sphingomonas edaphi TaxID=2315689 RepID=A0A418Q0S8_9SPHN|nr:DNA polymerase III subunit delta' [Sphingomonas edaphi]
MTLMGQDTAVDQFASAWRSGRVHHAWLLAGPKGVGKASFARAAALRCLAEAAGPAVSSPWPETPTDHPVSRLLAAGSHPDFRWIERLENARGDGLARNISIKQIRELWKLFSVVPSQSPWRAVVIDSVDDLEGPAANALLKMLEEPPPNSLFFLVSHSPGRLLPTIRSRCRRLEFHRLSDDVMTSLINHWDESKNCKDVQALVDVAQGSIGAAMEMAALDLAPLAAEALTILRDGDPDNGRRSKLASTLSGKAAAERYAAFLSLVPPLIAKEAVDREGDSLARILEAYSQARETSAIAPRLSLDPAATVFHIGGILASASLKR